MSALNRREMLKMCVVGSLGTMINESGSPGQVTAADVPSAEVAAGKSPIQTRMFWTWDHSTEWALNRPGAHTHGSCNEYGRTTDAFLADYTALTASLCSAKYRRFTRVRN